MHMRTGGPAMAAPEESLRRRKAGNAGAEPGSPPGTGRDPVGCSARLRAGTFWLTRIVLLRALAFIYCIRLVSENRKRTPWEFSVACGGLIKIRGDRCWRDLTCMDFHYETQPVPNPVAYFLHRSPWWVHRFETLSNHFLELVVPFFIFLGRQMCALHGALQILFQVVLIISGNLSFLNWLTMVPSVACFDDATLGFLFPSGPGALKDRVLKLQEETARGARPTLRYGCMVRRAVHVALGVLVAWLSVPVVINLLSPTQVMNTSFNPLRIVNTYGAFGSITKERTEVILQGTASPNASLPDAVWEDYEFKCKPGDPGRRPCLISPYHHRLDWLMWFAAFQTYEHNEWIIHLAGKLLANDATALSLLALNPFKDRAPPRWVRGEHYRYKFSRPGGQHAAAGKWWVRKKIGAYFPPLSLRDLKDYFRSREWPYPEPD
ncbi:lipase maturation factor 1 isoform X5 [Ailuropoda melanoleuca]|uniref:lipase maturation factor 1 isoform X5 n=1 Tax=Ailuropoda melanoleuca TaxID=9646 RepID=UPI0014947881|nr:lipase maturation factor 1 isoform X5 [Ailuropoda melanoleuca]